MKKLHILSYLGIAALITFTSSCSQNHLSVMPNSQVESTENPIVQKDNSTFDTYLNTMFCEEVIGDTITLHYKLAYPENFGITEYPVTLGNYSLETFEETESSLLKFKKELSSFSRESLSSSQQFTYDILMDYIETELDVSDLYLYSEILSPTTGYQAQLPVLLAEYTFRTEQDIKDYLALLSDIENLYAEIISFEQEKSHAGLFMPDFNVNGVIAQCEEFITDPDNNYMIEIFNDKINAFEGLSDQKRDEYIQTNHRLITNDVTRAYQLLIDGLTALKGTGTNDQGLCYYENGKKYYEYLVRTSTGSASSVPELQEMTDRYISDSLKTLFKIISAHPELAQQLDDYQFCATEPSEILEDLKKKIANDFPPLPDVSFTIKYVHPSMQEHASPAFYLTTPIDDIQNNLIYINQKYIDDDLYTTLAHEGYPGHLYQTVYSNSQKLPLIRNLFSFPGYTEGWATYVEYYSYEIGGLEQEIAQALMLNSSTSLGLYAAIDMGVNYDGWTQEDVMAYLDNFGLGSEEISTEIFQAMIEEPANYLSYFIGYLEFLKLREHAQTALGEHFSLKEFHTFLLEIGPAPFDLIAAEMEKWIQTKQ